MKKKKNEMASFFVWLVFCIIMAVICLAASALTGVTVAAMSSIVFGTSMWGPLFWWVFWSNYALFGVMVALMIKDEYLKIPEDEEDDKTDME